MSALRPAGRRCSPRHFWHGDGWTKLLPTSSSRACSSAASRTVALLGVVLHLAHGDDHIFVVSLTRRSAGRRSLWRSSSGCLSCGLCPAALRCSARSSRHVGFSIILRHGPKRELRTHLPFQPQGRVDIGLYPAPLPARGRGDPPRRVSDFRARASAVAADNCTPHLACRWRWASVGVTMLAAASACAGP